VAACGGESPVEMGGEGRRENEIRLGGSATADPTTQPEMKVEDGKRDSWRIIAPIECTYFHCVLIQKKCLECFQNISNFET